MYKQTMSEKISKLNLNILEIRAPQTVVTLSEPAHLCCVYSSPRTAVETISGVQTFSR